MAITALRIGIEIEVLLCAKRMKDQYKSCVWNFADSLVQYYNEKAQERPGRAEIRTPFDTWPAFEEYAASQCWFIMEDESINPDEGSSSCLESTSLRPWGVEFASPVMRYEFGSLWRKNLFTHFQIVWSYAEIMSNDTCGTHLHVSPGGSQWTLDQVRNVSRSIIYFEAAFEALLPIERRGNLECRSNRIDNPELRHLDLDTCCQRIQECTTIKALIHLMNAKEDCSFMDGMQSDRRIFRTERRYGFNFENLLDSKIGTIEFRKPPGVTNYEDCVMWAEFGASFFLAAMQYGITLDHLRTYSPTVAGLATFVDMAAVPGMHDPDILGRMFARAPGSLPVVGLRNYHHDEVWQL